MPSLFSVNQKTIANGTNLKSQVEKIGWSKN